MNDVTRILRSIDHGSAEAADDLLPIVYDELRRLAQQRLDRERPGQTLQATELVHEAYLRLVGPGEAADGNPNGEWSGRAHFFGAAAEAMRRILIDRARARGAAKRGGGRARLSLENVDFTIENPPEDLLDLDAALEKLAIEDPVKAQLVKLWFFGGLSLKDAGEALGLSSSTADRYWAYARAILYREMRRGTTDTDD